MNVLHIADAAFKLLNPYKNPKHCQCDATPAFILPDCNGHLVKRPILAEKINRREELSKSYKQLDN